jgi:hypothetical protein
MTIDFSENGRLDVIRKAVADFLDIQVFVYPAYANQISGLRSGVIGICVGLSDDAVGSITGHLFCDGSMVESSLNISLTGV